MQWPVQVFRQAGYAAVLASLSENPSSCCGHVRGPTAINASILYSRAQVCKAGERLVNLPAQCQLTYGQHTIPCLMRLIEKVPQEFWGAKLALQVFLRWSPSTIWM